jgi:hypothetical protein
VRCARACQTFLDLSKVLAAAPPELCTALLLFAERVCAHGSEYSFTSEEGACFFTPHRHWVLQDTGQVCRGTLLAVEGPPEAPIVHVDVSGDGTEVRWVCPVLG